MSTSNTDNLHTVHLNTGTLLKVGHWNLHSDLRALREGLVGEQHSYSRTWHNRRQYVVGTLMELLTKCDVVVTTENTHFWWILHTLQLGDSNIKGEFCATTAPSDHIRGLYEAYRLHTLSLDESICFEDHKELFSQVFEKLESCDISQDEQYDTVNAWYHFEQHSKIIDALKCTLGWTSYDDEHVPSQMRPMDKKGDDLYLSMEGIGMYWNSKRIKHVATLNHDDVKCISSFPCNDHAITGHRFLVIDANHIVDVFGAQLADGSTIDKDIVDERIYEAGLKRLILWMHSYDHSHVDQQIACISHVGYSADGERPQSLSQDDLIGKGIDYDALLIEPASLEALPNDVELVDILPSDSSTSVCRLRSKDGQLTVDTLDRIIVRTGRMYGSGSDSDSDSDSDQETEHATNDYCRRLPFKHISPAITHPLTYGTISEEIYSVLRKWSLSPALRRALRNGACFENWCEYMGANYVTDTLNRTLPDINHERSIDSEMHSLYPNNKCWSDHPPVTACIPDRDIAAYLEPTIGSKKSIGRIRKRSRCNSCPTFVGMFTSLSTYMLHTYMNIELTSGLMLALQSVTAGCLFYSGWAVGCT